MILQKNVGENLFYTHIISYIKSFLFIFELFWIYKVSFNCVQTVAGFCTQLITLRLSSVRFGIHF